MRAKFCRIKELHRIDSHPAMTQEHFQTSSLILPYHTSAAQDHYYNQECQVHQLSRKSSEKGKTGKTRGWQFVSTEYLFSFVYNLEFKKDVFILNNFQKLKILRPKPVKIDSKRHPPAEVPQDISMRNSRQN
ncbi:MAG: hypothetical protein II613_00050, partial [Bacteroidales bacterium]|nr:hypothetical protein [Bacteroidales bacterium]